MPGFMKPHWLKNIPRVEARAALLSLAVGVTLLAVKFGAYLLTKSAVIFSDALESIVNVAAGAVALYALSVAHRPADLDHPYGHGKVEFMSAGFEGGMIFVAAGAIIFQTIGTIYLGLTTAPLLERPGTGLILVAAAMAVNAAMGAYLIGVGRRHCSLTLEADGWHLISDAGTSGAALIGLGLIALLGMRWWLIDPIAAIVMAIYLGLSGVRMMRRSAAGLMDKQDLADQKTLEHILDDHVGGRDPAICSYHKLRHRHSGRYHWVDFHIRVPDDLDIQKAHQIASSIEYEIERTLGEGNATAHIEPCADSRCPRCGGPA